MFFLSFVLLLFLVLSFFSFSFLFVFLSFSFLFLFLYVAIITIVVQDSKAWCNWHSDNRIARNSSLANWICYTTTKDYKTYDHPFKFAVVVWRQNRLLPGQLVHANCIMSLHQSDHNIMGRKQARTSNLGPVNERVFSERYRIILCIPFAV